MRQQLRDFAGWLSRQAIQHILEIGQRVDPVQFRRLNQAHDSRRPLAGAQTPGE